MNGHRDGQDEERKKKGLQKRKETEPDKTETVSVETEGNENERFFPDETKRGDAGDEPNKRFERKHMFAQREKKSQQKNLIENKEVETKESFVIKISGGC